MCKQKGRRKIIDRMAKDPDITLPQETHSNLDDFGVHLPPGASLAAGGVAALISRKLPRSDDVAQVSEVAPGRVLRVWFRSVSGALIAWTVHNFAWLPGQLRGAMKLLEGAARAVAGAPAMA